MRIDSSSGNSARSRFAICSGLHEFAQRRSCRRPRLRPFHRGVAGPGTGRPSGVRMTPARRSCTQARNRSLTASFAVFGPRRSPVAMPLRDHRPIDQLPAPGSGIATQFPGDRRRRSSQASGDLSNAGRARRPGPRHVGGRPAAPHRPTPARRHRCVESGHRPRRQPAR
jgi:hypothetical protein